MGGYFLNKIPCTISLFICDSIIKKLFEEIYGISKENLTHGLLLVLNYYK